MNTDKLIILHETEDYIVVNKPAGLLVHPYAVKGGAETTEETLASLLLVHCPELKFVGDDPIHRPGIVHRLDRETSGVLLVAKTQAAFDYFKVQFQTHQIQKEYEAIVHGIPNPLEGVIDKAIGLKNGTIKRTVHGGRMVKEAVTTYRVLEQGTAFSRIQVIPKTGRTHQIRVHMSSNGNPLVGDSMYGTATSKKIDATLGIQRCMLHAHALSCTTPSGEGVRFEVAPPSDFQAAWQKLSTHVFQ